MCGACNEGTGHELLSYELCGHINFYCTRITVGFVGVVDVCNVWSDFVVDFVGWQWHWRGDMDCCVGYVHGFWFYVDSG